MGISQQIGASSLIKAGVVDNTANRPASPYEGQVIFQKDTDQMLVWNGTAWVIPNQTTTNPEGLELVKAQTVGTGVSSVTVTNAFSATYDNYLITYSGGTATATTGAMFLQLGPSSISNYNTGYYSFLVYGGYVTPTVGGASNNNTDKWNWIGGTIGSGGVYSKVELFCPNLPLYTRIYSPSYEGSSNSGHLGGVHKFNTAYTDFTLIPESGTITSGTVRVYGYRNS